MKKTFDTEIMVGLDRTAVIRLTMPGDVSTGLHRATIVFDPVEKQADALPVLFNPEGLWAGQGTDVSDEELAAARSEMWGKLDYEEPL
jgi:hypothetical protein